jgi:adenylate kinase
VRLSHHYVIDHIATGDMLRAAVKMGTPLGLEARRFMDAGELIPDEVVLGMVDERLDQDHTRSRGFILDGFPRTVVQAQKLDELLAPLEIDLVINLDVPTNAVMRRLASRRVCVDCGANYSTQKPPKVGWICDNCSGEVVQREDDTEAAIKRRLDVYEEQTAPLIDRYKQLGKLATIAGMGTMDAVTARMISIVDQRLGKGRGSL